MGNDVTVVVAALAVSLALFLAGAVLALCLIKYNLFLPAAPADRRQAVVAIRKRRSGWRSFFSGGVLRSG